VVAGNVGRLRRASGLTKTALAAALREAGRPIDMLAIARIECGKRRVDADDLIALAVALGVNPSALLLPPADQLEDVFEVTGAGEVSARRAWDWADGQHPLEVPADDPGRARLLFALRARPAGRR